MNPNIKEGFRPFYELPDLKEAPPSVENPSLKCLGLIPLFIEENRYYSDIEALFRAALYSRWSALNYTDAVDLNIEINFFMDKRLYAPFRNSILKTSYVQMRGRVLVETLFGFPLVILMSLKMAFGLSLVNRCDFSGINAFLATIG